MKIAIMCSLAFAEEAGEIRDSLEKAGHEASVSYTTTKILEGEFTLENIARMKEDGSIVEYAKEQNSILENLRRMENDDAILVVNLEKKGIENYIGGNTFLEMGVAYYLGKKIFLWNELPENEYCGDEMKCMQPIVLNQDIERIK